MRSFFVKVWVFKNSYRSKMVERRLFAIIDLLQGANAIFLYFIWRVGELFLRKVSSFGKKNISFYYI